MTSDAAPGYLSADDCRLADLIDLVLSDRSGVVTGSVIDWDQNVLGGMD